MWKKKSRKGKEAQNQSVKSSDITHLEYQDLIDNDIDVGDMVIINSDGLLEKISD